MAMLLQVKLMQFFFVQPHVFGSFSLDVVEKTVFKFGLDKENINIAWKESQKTTSEVKTKNTKNESVFNYNALFRNDKKKIKGTQNGISSRGTCNPKI